MKGWGMFLFKSELSMHSDCERYLSGEHTAIRMNEADGGMHEEVPAMIDLDTRSIIYEGELAEEFSQPLVDGGGVAGRSSLIWKLSGILLAAAALYVGNAYLLARDSALPSAQFSMGDTLRATLSKRGVQSSQARDAIAAFERASQADPVERKNIKEKERMALALIVKAIVGDPRTLALAAPTEKARK